MASVRSLVVKIGADVSNLETALKRAVTSSKGLESELSKIGDKGVAAKAATDLQRLQATMQAVTRQQQQAISTATAAARGIEFMGGAAKLTSPQLREMEKVLRGGLDAARALGQTAPKEIQKVADAIAKQRKELDGGASGGGLLGKVSGLAGSLGFGALTGAGAATALVAGTKAALDYADSLTKLADRTGIGAVELQRLGAVAAASGNDVEQIASAVNAFQKRLVEDSDATSAALGRINLTTEQLRALSPDEQFFAIAKGVAAIKDPAEQTRTAMDLFGKAGADILPTLKADVDKLKDSTFTMSEESVAALDKFGDDLTSFGTSAVNVLGEVAGAALRAAGAVADMAGSLPSPSSGPAPGTPLPTSGLIQLDAARAQVQAFTGEVTFMGRTVRESTVGLVQGFQQGADAVDDIHAAFKAFADQSAERAAAAIAQFDRNLADVLQRSAGFASVLDTIDGSVVEAIRYYREQGVELAKVAQVYALTETQVWALGEAEKAEQAMLAALTRGQESLTKALKDRKRESLEVLEVASRPVPSVGILQGGANPQLAQFTKQAGELDTAIRGISEAYGLMAQIGGDSFGKVAQTIGTVIGQINLAQQALKSLSGASLTTGQQIGASVATIGFNVLFMFGRMQQQAEDLHTALLQLSSSAARAAGAFSPEARGIVGQNVIQFYRDAIEHARSLTAAQVYYNQLLDEMNRAQSLVDDVRSLVGPSQTQLEQEAERAKQILDYVTDAERRRKDGQPTPDNFTAEQQATAYYNWQKAMAAAGNQAAKAWVEAHDAVVNGSASASKAIDDLRAKRDGLAQSIENEAPEAVMGVIESQIRGQIAALDAQLNAQQTAVDENVDQAATAATETENAFKNCWAQVGEDGRSAADYIRDLFGDLSVHVRVNYDYGDGPVVPGAATGGRVVPGGIQHFADGGRVLPFLRRGTDTVPAMLTPGEIVINAAQQGRLANALRGGGAQVGAINVAVYPAPGENEQQLAERVVSALRTNAVLYEAVSVVSRRAGAA